nr:hypothetical protein [Terricaulis silvestris]
MRPNGEDVYGVFDIFHRVRAHVLEFRGDFARDLIANIARHGDAAHGRKRLQARGDVDAFAIHVVTVDDHIAQIDADAIAKAFGIRPVGFGSTHRRLNVESAGDGSGGAGKFNQHAIAHEFKHTPALCDDSRIEKRFAVLLQSRERPCLVALHQAAVADDVGRKDDGQFSLHGRPGSTKPT